MFFAQWLAVGLALYAGFLWLIFIAIAAGDLDDIEGLGAIAVISAVSATPFLYAHLIRRWRKKDNKLLRTVAVMVWGSIVLSYYLYGMLSSAFSRRHGRTFFENLMEWMVPFGVLGFVAILIYIAGLKILVDSYTEWKARRLI